MKTTKEQRDNWMRQPHNLRDLLDDLQRAIGLLASARVVHPVKCDPSNQPCSCGQASWKSQCADFLIEPSTSLSPVTEAWYRQRISIARDLLQKITQGRMTPHEYAEWFATCEAWIDRTTTTAEEPPCPTK